MLITDLVEPQKLLGFTRTVLLEQERNVLILSQFLPNTPLLQLDWSAVVSLLRDEDAATVRAWDTPATIAARQGITRLFGSMMPISRKIPLGEEETLRVRELLTQDNSGIVAQIYDDAAKMTRAVGVRLELLRGQALWSGKLDINENGVIQPVDFGRDDDLNVTAGTLWSDHAGAVPVTDETSWLQTYFDFNLINPAYVLMSKKIISNLLLSAQYRSLASMQGIAPAFLSIDQLNAVRTAYGLPQIIQYEVRMRVEGVQTRPIPENVCVFLPPSGEPLGATFMGPTAEALELAEAQQITAEQVPGLCVTVHKTDDPVSRWTKANATGTPALLNPNLSMAAVVLAP